MEFIERSPEPEYLSSNKEEWTAPWIAFYTKAKDDRGELIRAKKPSDNHWTKHEIRSVLISDFKNNCGYCGCSRPTPKSRNDSPLAPRGHVDHFKAKALYPELTYVWDNYIWSCESCNCEKGEFDDPENPILNPCVLEDSEVIEFVIDTGEYCLKNPEPNLKLRFSHTDQFTMMNANEIIQRRRNRVKSLHSLFENTDILIPLIHIHCFQIQINRNIKNIKDQLEDNEFYFLIRREDRILRNLYPQISILIDNFNL